MAKARRVYIMTKRIMTIIRRNGEKTPKCQLCGKPLKIGDLVFSKPSRSGRHNTKTRRYHNKCRKKLNIWL